MATKIQLRRGTAAQWTAANPILADGEIGLEKDTGKRKIGDGVQAWTALPYDLPQIAQPGSEMRILSLDALARSEQPTANTWVTPDGSGVVVHPSVRYFPTPFSGYHWWAAATPYKDADILLENPCVYVSEDGLHWTAAPGVTNPLIGPPPGGYNSDPYLTQDHQGRLLLYYREYFGVHDRIRLFTSTDGATWEGPVTVRDTDPAVSRVVAPSVWWEPRDQAWVMLGVEIVAEDYKLVRMTASAPEGPFVFESLPTLTPDWPAGIRNWHPDILPLGTQLVGVMMAQQTSPTSTTHLHLMTSEDGGRSWTRLDTPLESGSTYKSAIAPLVTDQGLGLHLWQGMGAPDFGTQYRQLLPPATPRTIAAMERALCFVGYPPYVFGDRFNRADDATGLGVATSGQAWVPDVGTLVVQGGTARGLNAGNHRATVDIGGSDYEISGVFRTASLVGQVYMVARYASGSSYIRCGMSSTSLYLQSVDPTVTHLVPSIGLPVDTTYLVTLRCKGDTLTVLLNGEVRATVTGAINPTATKIGIQANSNDNPLDDLTVKLL